jgi:mannose-1-phosphate guanylyltransferase/mannose-6-phosphate isomerase
MNVLTECHVEVQNSENTQQAKLIPVILCGGAGSRLWPLSREQHPKPFIKLTDGLSLLQKAFLRARNIPGIQHMVTITNRELFFKVEDEYLALDTPSIHQSYILEPVGRNTAPAILTAALHIQELYGDDAQILILPADHLIQDEQAFRHAVEKAKQFSGLGQLVTFGIEPDYPETGFGYIEATQHQVVRFIEKPTIEKAQEFIDKGQFYWNSGMFCFPVGKLIQLMSIHAQDIYEKTLNCFHQARLASGANFSQIELPASFAEVPDNSIDYALMEPASHQNGISVVPCQLGWSDIGSWNALSELVEADQNDNRIVGDVFLEDSSNVFVHSEDRVVGGVGIQDLIIVDTPDALLVAHKNKAQSVKNIYNNLKQHSHQVYKLHRTVHRPWGTYTILEEGQGFKIKRIEVKPNASLSLQMHYHRSEHWIVVSGMAKVVNGDDEFLIQTNQSTYIPAGHKHRLHNPGKIPLVMIEVQSGSYLEEDDIVRFEDVYGRV